MKLRSLGSIVLGVVVCASVPTAVFATKTQVQRPKVAISPVESVSFPALQVTAWKVPSGPIQQVSLGDPTVLKDQALIPLPPATWTGLTGLAIVSILATRKTIFRYVTA